MKLLFDENLSPRLAARVADIFPECAHVSVCGIERAEDEQVWEFARVQCYCVVTKDSDFNDFGTLRGSPPKVVWLRIGNCTTAEIEALLGDRPPRGQPVDGLRIDRAAAPGAVLAWSRAGP